MSKSKNPKIAIKNPDMRQYISGQIMVAQMTDSGAGILAGRLCEYTSGQIKFGTEQNIAPMGITRNAIGAGLTGDVEWGFVPAMLAGAVAKGDRIAPRASGFIGKAQTSQVSLLNASAGGGFTNQPANDGIEIVSAAAGDTTQTITLYGTLNGATTVLVTEVIALNGVTQVVSTHADWGVLLAARLSAVCAGNVTIREASGNAAITTITAASLTAGIAAPTSTNAFGLIPRHDGSGASTDAVCISGYALDGTVLESVDAMNGATEEDHGTTPFSLVKEFYLGAVGAGVNVNVLTNEATDASCYCGIALETKTSSGPCDCWIKPYWM